MLGAPMNVQEPKADGSARFLGVFAHSLFGQVKRRPARRPERIAPQSFQETWTLEGFVGFGNRTTFSFPLPFLPIQIDS